MAGRKRKATDAPARRRVSRRTKQPEADSSCPTRDEMSTREAPSSPKSYLDKMPSEILQQIFLYSREPCLIHTCSRLHRILPSFTLWTRRLAGLALIETPGPKDGTAAGFFFEDNSPAAFANRADGLPLVGFRAPLEEHVRHELQKEVF
jgi:hypothetical protein